MRAPILVAIALALASPARAELVEVQWDASGRFERRLEVPAGKFAEACGRLAKGESVRWEFEAADVLDFNIHYHVGQTVEYPVRKDAQSRMHGTLQVALDQGYCWMWVNKAMTAVTLEVRLERRGIK